MKAKRLIAAALSLCLILSIAGPGAARAVTRSSNPVSIPFTQVDNDSLDLNIKKDSITNDLSLKNVDPDEIVRIIIIMESESVVEQDGHAVPNEETQALMQALTLEQSQVISAIETSALNGSALDVSYSYTWLLNGVAAAVPFGSIAAIEQTPGVKQVLLQPVYEVCQTAEPHTITDGVMIGREQVWANGYTGKGITIAVIDTGLDHDHQNFGPLSQDKLTADSATPDTVAAVLDQLNASQRYAGLTVEDVYYSSKVAFGFNYCDDNLNITHDYDGMGDHGTHVAGIAAANKVEESEVVGVAPDAQLYVMKVFGEDGGAYAEDILAGLEDALILGADVVNMSLGTNAGFTTSTDEVNAIYNRVAQTNTVLSVSAGNNYTAGYGNTWGTDMNLTSHPDNSVISEPAIYRNVLSIASVENCMIMRNYIAAGDHKLSFVETSASYQLPSILTMTESYSYAVVPGYGAAEDFEGLDLTGKIALVQRGVEDFVTKVENAEAAGAIACIVYNNAEGEFGMDLTGTSATIPAISITMANGEYLISALAENPQITLSFPKDPIPMTNEEGYTMNSFSSWGVTPDLILEPDITAPGGNIYSTINDGEYGLMSGTSMAAPNLSGITALLMQYVKANYSVEDGQFRTLVQNLLMSTSVPLVYDSESGLCYSPRQQGSGLANAYNAVNSTVYLSVDTSDTPKVSLGDDPARTGVYSYVFKITNFGTADAYYGLQTSLQSEDVTEIDGNWFMSGTPLALAGGVSYRSDALFLTHDLSNDGISDVYDAYLIWQAVSGNGAENMADSAFRYDTNGDSETNEADVQAYLDALVGLDSAADPQAQSVRAAAGQSIEVTVDVTLSEEDHEFFATYYPNGGYVEGFTFLNAQTSGGIDLSLPYMGFYGSWDEPNVLDDGFYWDYVTGDEEAIVGNQYVNVLWTQFYGEAAAFYPGLNAYIDEPFDVNHISLSPNYDGYVDTIDDIYISLLRNAATLTFRYLNAETGEVYYDQSVSQISKSCYNLSYGQIIPSIYSWFTDEIPEYDFKDSNGADLPNNTKLLLQVEAVGAYEGATPEVWEVPITIDLEAPQLLSVIKSEDPETGAVTLELTFRDNLSVAAVSLMNSNGQEVYYLDGTVDTEPDENGYQNYTVSYDITDIQGKLLVVLGDYALNETFYAMNTGGEGTPYGSLVAYQYNIDADSSGWVSFDMNPETNEVQITQDDMNFVCAEYIDGFIFAQTETGALYGFRYADMLKDTFDIETTFIAQLDNTYQDLAYSYNDGRLYGLLTTEDSWGASTNIYTINIHGEYYDEDSWTTVAPYQEDWYASRGSLYGLTMAVDDQGTIYVLGTETIEVKDPETGKYVSQSSTAQLWKFTEEVISGMHVKRFSKVGDTGLNIDYLQSMTWDHNTGTLYWSRFWPTGMFDFECQLLTLDPKTAEPTLTGTLSGETCALFAPLTAETVASSEIYQNIPHMDTTQVARPILRDDVVNLNIGSQLKLNYDLDPWYSDHRDVIWSSSDETVACVDDNGTVTALHDGTVTVTVTAKDDPSLSDSCTVNVTALTLNIGGIVSIMDAGLGNTGSVCVYDFSMVDGNASFQTGASITASDELNFGLSLVTSVLGRGSLWASEYGNTGMIYEIDPQTGIVKDVLMPMDGDMIFGMTYSQELDTFAAIMNMYLYVDLQLTHEEEQQVLSSYSEEHNEFMYHKLNMLPYLIESNTGFVTNEYGQGASSEIVMCGITTLPGGYVYSDTYQDYMGNPAYSGSVNYTASQTLVILDNVGRLWYIDEITGMEKTVDAQGNATYSDANGNLILTDGALRNGMLEMEIVNPDGSVCYSVFHIRSIDETPLTTMFREGTMPRITYHFSDIEFGGFTEDGAPIFAMSLYDYWNNAITNELYLYIPAVTQFDYELSEEVELAPEKFYNLGDTGTYKVIASIHSLEVLGGLSDED